MLERQQILHRICNF